MMNGPRRLSVAQRDGFWGCWSPPLGTGTLVGWDDEGERSICIVTIGREIIIRASKEGRVGEDGVSVLGSVRVTQMETCTAVGA